MFTTMLFHALGQLRKKNLAIQEDGVFGLIKNVLVFIVIVQGTEDDELYQNQVERNDDNYDAPKDLYVVNLVYESD